MRILRRIFGPAGQAMILIGMVLLLVSHVGAQGSIVGELRNADLSTPPDDAIHFFGFIDDTDSEVRLHSCTGAGYESGYWWDDFQNYITKAPDMPYQFRFFNVLNGQSVVLESIIPDNSYEEQDVSLESTGYPAPADGISAAVEPGPQVRLQWLVEPGVTWHVYRRAASSNGSFFRVDNAAGDRLDPGVSLPEFVDVDVLDGAQYHYILVTESSPDSYSPASAIVEVDLSSCCRGLVGNVNGLGGDEPTIGDISLLIDHLFITMTPLSCLEEADVNQSGGVNPSPDDISLSDIAVLIDHLFITGVAIPECL